MKPLTFLFTDEQILDEGLKDDDEEQEDKKSNDKNNNEINIGNKYEKKSFLDKYDINHIMPNHTLEDVKETLIKIYGDEPVAKKLVAFKFEYLSSDKE